MKRINLLNVLSALATACLLFTGGCASNGEFGDRTAVMIYNQEPAKIIEMTTRVFVSKGFAATKTTDDSAVYERRGSTMQNMAYGSWMSGNVWERATVTVEPYAKGALLLVADVELLSNKEDEFFREEKKMSKRARKPFQEMLDQAANQLSGFPAVDNAK